MDSRVLRGMVGAACDPAVVSGARARAHRTSLDTVPQLCALHVCTLRANPVVVTTVVQY